MKDKYDVAEKLLKKCLDYRKQNKATPHIASIYNSLCLLYHKKGLFEEAIRCGELSVKYAEMAYGKGAIHTDIMQSYIFLGHVCLDADNLPAAKEYLEKALDMAIKLYGRISRGTAEVYNHLGQLYDVSSAKANLHVDPSFAEECDLNALLIREQLFGEEKESVADQHRRLASLYNDVGKYRQAEEHARKALEIRAKLGDRGSASYAAALKELGIAYKLSGKPDEAKPVLKEAAEIYDKGESADSFQHSGCVRQLCYIYIDEKNYDLAEKLLLENLDFRMRLNSMGAVATAHFDLCELYTAWKRYPEALDHGEQALACAKKAHGEQTVTVTILFCYNRLGTACLEMGRYDDAKANLEKALDMARILYVPHHKTTAELYFRLGRAYEQTNDLVTATDHYQTAWEIRRDLFGVDHPDTVEVAERLKALRK